MKVTIVNCYHDSNKGSSAILWGLIRRLQRTGLVNSISLVSMFQKTHPFYESSLRHVKTEFPDLVTAGAPLPSSHVWRTTKHKKIGEIRGRHARLLSAINAAIRLKRLTRNNALVDEACREIVTSDLVLDRGGPFFAAENPFLNLNLYHNAYPLLVARKFGVPIGFAPGTFGPFASHWGKRFMRQLCEGSAFIMARDPISKDVLASFCGVNPDRIAITGDSAFWVEPRLSERVKRLMSAHRLEPRQFLAVTTRQWHPEVQKKYHSELAATIDKLVPNYFGKALLVANMVDPGGYMGDDRQASRELYQCIQKKEYVSVLDDDLGPDELVALYGQAGTVLGTRLHSVIMALAAGTPATAVSYAGHKTHGVMQAVGFNQYSMELETFTRKSALDLVQTASAMHGEVTNKITKLRLEGDKVFNASLQSVANHVGCERSRYSVA